MILTLAQVFPVKILINIFFHWHTKSALRWTRFFRFLFLIFVILISLTIFTVLNYECRSKIILAIIKSFYTSLKLIKFSNFAVFVWYTGLAQFSLIIKRCKNSHSSIKYLLLRYSRLTWDTKSVYLAPLELSKAPERSRLFSASVIFWERWAKPVETRKLVCTHDSTQEGSLLAKTPRNSGALSKWAKYQRDDFASSLSK